MHDPEIMIMDEPTVGIDPQSRNYILDMVRNLNREKGLTVLYTSHYMEEVENYVIVFISWIMVRSLPLEQKPN